MAKQTINLGTAANDRTGTNLRAAFDICNDNFSELFVSKTQFYQDSYDLSNPPTKLEIISILGAVANAATDKIYIINDTETGDIYLVATDQTDYFYHKFTKAT